MSSVFEKLNLKNQDEILVLNAPESFEKELSGLTGVNVVRDVKQLEGVERVLFSLAFVTRQRELDQLVAMIVAKSPGDTLLWFAYPKGTSKRYHCDFNRDTGWKALYSTGFKGVRQVAIDEDWTALRFRRKEYVK